MQTVYALMLKQITSPNLVAYALIAADKTSAAHAKTVGSRA